MYSLWQELSVDTKIFDLVTLTFDLLLKKINLGHNFWTKRDRAFIFHMGICCDKTFLLEPTIFTSWPWPWLLTYFWKKLDLDHNFWTKSVRPLILHISIPCDKTFLLIPIFLAHLSQRLEWAIVIAHRPSSVVRPSVRRRRRRPSGVNFSDFRLLLQNRLMDFDETWYAWSTHGPLQVLLFFGQIHPGANPGRGKNRSCGVPFFKKLLL